MEDLLKMLREGRFTQESYCLVLENGQRIWTDGGLLMYDFQPNNGAGFSFSEKIAIHKALKAGNLAKAIKPTP